MKWTKQRQPLYALVSQDPSSFYRLRPRNLSGCGIWYLDLSCWSPCSDKVLLEVLDKLDYLKEDWVEGLPEPQSM